MTNNEKAENESNMEKEKAEKNFYGINKVNEEMYDCENEDAVAEICKVLINRRLSYREANGVLYNADKALRIRALDKRLL